MIVEGQKNENIFNNWKNYMLKKWFEQNPLWGNNENKDSFGSNELCNDSDHTVDTLDDVIIKKWEPRVIMGLKALMKILGGCVIKSVQCSIVRSSKNERESGCQE